MSANNQHANLNQTEAFSIVKFMGDIEALLDSYGKVVFSGKEEIHSYSKIQIQIQTLKLESKEIYIIYFEITGFLDPKDATEAISIYLYKVRDLLDRVKSKNKRAKISIILLSDLTRIEGLNINVYGFEALKLFGNIQALENIKEYRFSLAVIPEFGSEWLISFVKGLINSTSKKPTQLFKLQSNYQNLVKETVKKINLL